MAKIVVFNKPDFKGKKTTIFTKTMDTLKGTGINNAISSIIVIEGTWTLYKKPNYNGRIETITRNGGPNNDGTYHNYQDWNGKNNNISSIQLNDV